MLDFFTQLATNAQQALDRGDPLALLLLLAISALTELGIPFPFILDAILVLTGIRTGIFSAKVGMIMLSLLVGRIIGASIIYWASRGAGQAFVNWLTRRFPSTTKKIDWLENKLRRRAPIAIAVTRLTPGLLTPSTVAAAIIKIRYVYLLAGIGISSVIADALLLFLGWATGRGIEFFGFELNIWMLLVAMFIILAIVWFIGHLISKRNNT